MKIVKYSEIRNELINNLRRNTVIPMIGSGFTRQCNSLKGVVPSGSEYKEFMIKEIAKTLKLPAGKIDAMRADSFSKVSTYYNKVVPPKDRQDYLYENFTSVQLDLIKKDFLAINWPYIYTLNIDDGIEKNSPFNFVIYANRPPCDGIFTGKKYVIKLHGDVADMITYADSDCEVFTQGQYVDSLNNNKILLTKLSHDMQFHNMLFVGCSLDDEIDILACALQDKTINTSARYFCAVEEPDALTQIQLEQYGITHYILFDTYDAIYEELIAASAEANKIRVDDLDPFRSSEVAQLGSSFEENKSYLLFGKSLIGKNRKITFPHFFIHRDITDSIYTHIEDTPLQFVLANSCSGSSYVAVDIASRIRDRDVFIFETKDRISDEAFSLLLEKQNCVIIADCGSLSIEQIEDLISNREILKKNGSHAIVFAGKNNRDLANIFQLFEHRGVKNISELEPTQLKNKFSKHEIKTINPLLTAVGAGVFSSEKTMVDNIIDISDTLREKNKFDAITPRLRETKEIAALIAIATEKKLYSNRVVELDILSEIESQQKATDPLIERESTWSFEKNDDDNSPTKYVLSAEFWLYRKLEEFARVERNHDKIAAAYKYIVERIIAHEGRPNLDYNKKDASYKEYIMFDNINRIFCSDGHSVSGLIQKIYDILNDDLSSDPNYMHQRAKCRIKMASKAKSIDEQKAHLEQGFRDAGVAYQVFKQRYDKQCNEKIAISIAHVMYTRALILCHQAIAHNYSNIGMNSEAIRMLYIAMKSPYNTYAFARGDSYNYKNAIRQTIIKALAQKSSFSEDVYGFVEELFAIVSQAENEMNN